MRGFLSCLPGEGVAVFAGGRHSSNGIWTSSPNDTNTSGNGPTAGSGYKAKVKYRDPETNEMWSGRGLMASWLKRKQDAGEDVEGYLV